MIEEFVSYELALRLKNLGFDKPCVYYVDEDNNPYIYNFESHPDVFVYNCHCDVIKSPTFTQAFKWFREKYDLYSWVHLHNGYLNNSYYKKIPITWTIMEHESGKQYYERDIDHNYLYHTQEEAELACLKKLLEIIESK